MQNTFYRKSRVGSFHLGFAAFALFTIAAGSLHAQTELIALSPAALAFPVTVKGKPSAPLTVTVTSTGNTAVSFTSFAITGTDAAEFAITAKTCGAVLASGASCQVSITFTPTTTGTQTAALTITDSATNSPQSAALSGAGSNIVFTLRPAAIVFPVVSVGSTNTSQVTVTNIGIASASITSIALGGGDTGDFAIGTKTCGATLAAGASCTVNISFKPLYNGIRTSNLLFTDTASGSPQDVPLTGTAEAPTQTLIFSPNSLAFGPTNVDTLAPIGSISVTNYGSTTTTFHSATVAGSNPSDFLVVSTCQPLAPDQNCSMAIGFRPLAAGLRTAVLLVADTATGSPQSILLSGTGVSGGALLTFRPPAVSFAPQNIGVTANASVQLENFGVIGNYFSSFAISGKNASDFSVTTNGCPTGSTPLNPEQTCSIGITFTPTAAGVRVATLSVTDNAIGSPQLIPLSGTGQSLSKQLTFSNGILTFGSQPVGTSSGRNSVTVSSVGDTTVTLSSVLIGGTDPGDFSITSTSCYAGTTIAPNANCTVNLTFTPAAAGTRAATLTFTDDANGSPQVVTLEGVGDPSTQQLTFNYFNVNLGILDVGSTSSQSEVIIYNEGDSTVTFTSIAVSGTNAADFSVNSDACLTPNGLAPTQGCGVYVSFTPSATGVRTANLVFTDSATGSPQTVGLSGDGQSLTEFVTFSTPSLVFAGQTVGTTSGQALEYFENTGDSPITISSVSIVGGNASDFTLSTNTCPIGGAGVSPNNNCYVYVTFTPSAAGLRTSTLQFVDSATGSPHNVPLVGVGLPAVVPLSLSPTDINFSDQNVGTTSAGTNVNVHNPGATALSLSIVLAGTNAADYSILSNNCPGSLGANASCTVSVTFKPSAVGSRVAVLQFTAGGTVVDVGLAGIGTTGAMVLTIPQMYVDFGPINVGSTTGQSNVQISNNGTEAVTFTGFALGGSDPTDFTISNNNCGSTLTVGASCSVGLTFTPKATGVRTGTLQITDNAVGSPQSVPLNGIGQAVTMTLDVPQAFSFGVANIATSVSQYQYVYNVGTAPVTISSITITGADAGDFAVGQTNCTGGSVAAAGNCYFYISFTPTVAGIRTAAVQLTDNATGSPQSVSLNGVGQTPSMTLVLPQAVSLPLTVVGSNTQSSAVYVSNLGTATVTLSNVAITGANASEFSISGGTCTAGANINAGSYCYLYVTFAPTVAGNAAAAVQFTDNAAGSPQSIALSGVGQSSTFTLSLPPSITFPPVTIGGAVQSSPNYIYNTGTSTVILTSVAITGTNASEFTITSGTCTAGASITPGSNCYIYVTFTPSALGNQTASVQFTDDAVGSPQSITLTGVGQGLTDTATFDPLSLSFGNVTVGTNSGAQYSYLENTGTGAITLSAISITGANAADFVLDGGSCAVGTVLNPGGSCYIYVYFSPTAKGAFTANLQVTDNAVGGTQQATLTGTGQ